MFGDWVQEGLLSRQTELRLGSIVQLGLRAQRELEDSAKQQNPSTLDSIQAASLEKGQNLTEVSLASPWIISFCSRLDGELLVPYGKLLVPYGKF